MTKPKTSGKPSAVTSAILAAVMPMDAVLALAQPERIARFADRATAGQRAFAEMGKLRRAIERNLKPNQDFTNLLRKAGVRDGTISNSSYGARVFDLVEAGHLTEQEYDTFAFADCVAICRATGGQSKLRLDGPQAAIVIRESPKTFDAELNCLYEHGVSVADKKAADAKAQAAADAKAAAAPSSVGGSGDSPDAAGDPPAASSPPKPVSQPGNAGESPAETGESPVPPSNVVESGITNTEGSAANPTPPGAVPKPAVSKLGQVMNLLDALELMFADLPIEEARQAAPRLAELTDTVLNYVASTPAEQKAAVKAAAKAAPKGKGKLAKAA